MTESCGNGSVIDRCDLHTMFIVSGNGEVIEPEEGIAAIGSGGELCPGGSPCLDKVY